MASWNDGSVTVGYGWDDAGNLVGRGGVTGTFNERNQLLQHGDVSFTYTARGTMSSRKDGLLATAIEYNAFDQLVSDGGTNYAYDGLNRLVQAGGKALEYVGAGIDVAFDGTRRYTYTPDGQVLGVGGVAATVLDPAEPAGVGWSDLHTDLVGVVDPASGAFHGSRSYDPFGRVVASDGVRPGLGYQHQFTDPGTGNVNMGARWYQPGTGTFASRDAAVLDPRDVGNANRYGYAGANPLTQTDPQGYFWGKVWGGIKRAARGALNVVKEVSGYNDLKGCLGGSWGSCGWFVAGLTPFGKVAKGLKYGAKALGRFGRGSKAAKGSSRFASKARHYGGPAKASYKRVSTKLGRAGHAVAYSARGYTRGAVRGAAKGFARGGGTVYRSSAAAAAAARAAAEAARLAARRAMVHRRAVTPAAKPPKTASVSPSVQAKDAANNQPAIDFGAWGVGDDALGAGGRAADEVVPAPMEPPVFTGPASGGVPPAGPVGPPRPDAGLPSAGPKPGAGGACKVANSFVPGTKVVLADGSAKPIERVKLRDKVLAEDPVTGERGAREVVATISGDGEKRLVELTVDTDGDHGDATGTVVATDGHPFWVPDLREWKTAGELRAGSLLQTSAGTWVQVVTVAERTQQQRVHNLTIDDLHTYHVTVGSTDLLVHNTGPGLEVPASGCGEWLPSYGDLTRARQADAHHIIQDTAARNVPGYSRSNAPAIRLDGPSTKKGSSHYGATQVQRSANTGGTYGAERDIACSALLAAGCSTDEVAGAIARADAYFMGQLGLTLDSPMRIPGNRRTR